MTNNRRPKTASLAERTVASLNFFSKWETPLDLQAAKVYRGIRSEAPDFDTFKLRAPAGSEDRRMVERFFASFEDAGNLIRAGQMREDLFFDSWYNLPSAWNRAKPYVLGLRAETHNPKLYEAFEWLAERSELFWRERETHPPTWKPIESPEPNVEEKAVFEAFSNHSLPDKEAWEMFDHLQGRAPTFEAFTEAIPAGSPDFITFDLVMCAYDRAGVLIKNGILHPALLLESWRSPVEIWEISEKWVRGLQQKSNSTHIYENVEWLAVFERKFKSQHDEMKNSARRSLFQADQSDK